VIEDLNPGSATATARGLGDAERIYRVIRGYEDVGTALEQNEPVPFTSKRVRSNANGLRKIVGGRIQSVAFETADREAIILPVAMPDAPRVESPVPVNVPSLHPSASRMRPAYGAVTGRVQTLSNRGGLRFTLYDVLDDRAVSCYLAEGHEDLMRDMWGKMAIAEGLVTRDPSGRPVSVRRIAKVAERPVLKWTYRDARGAAPSESGLTAEQAIRRLRDA
jgi:hypothetical protein